MPSPGDGGRGDAAMKFTRRARSAQQTVAFEPFSGHSGSFAHLSRMRFLNDYKVLDLRA